MLQVEKKDFTKPGYIQYIELTSTGAGATRHLDHNCSTESDYIRYALKEKKRYYLGIFPKRRTPPSPPPPPPFGNPLSKKNF